MTSLPTILDTGALCLNIASKNFPTRESSSKGLFFGRAILLGEEEDEEDEDEEDDEDEDESSDERHLLTAFSVS